MSSSATLLIFGPESTSGSEKAGHPGDNALFVVVNELKSLGFDTIYTEVAMLPKGAPLTLARRAEAIVSHKLVDVTIIMGSDTERNLKSWFPVNEAIKVAQPFFFMNEPGLIKLVIAEKINESFEAKDLIFGFDINDKTIGVNI